MVWQKITSKSIDFNVHSFLGLSNKIKFLRYLDAERTFFLFFLVGTCVNLGIGQLHKQYLLFGTFMKCQVGIPRNNYEAGVHSNGLT